MIVFIPLAALMVVLSEPVCLALAQASIVSLPGASEEHDFLVSVAMAVRDFSLGNNAAAMPAGEDYRTAITPDAIAHLLDVRIVFIAALYATMLLFLALVILIVVVVRRSGVKALARPLVAGGAVPLAAAAILGVAITLDFNAFFTWMHGIFFASGTWTFPADSLLIRALPYEFWIACAVVWAASMAVLCAVSIVLGALFGRRPASAPVDAAEQPEASS